MRWAAVVALVAAAAAVVLVWQWTRPRTGEAATIATGRALYARHCASCHGANLEGQPDWTERRPSGRLPAPPHDPSGHTWHHGDDTLFRITREGTAAVVGRGYQSDMPGFGGVLSDEEIRAVLAYIKSTWPERLRRYQEEVSRREHGR
jgi:mono/diheme cytochrome c family protein